MTPIVLGLDIGGANLKAATADRRAVSVPFPLWKQPDKLSTALAAIVAQFPEVTEFAVTMTGELCDCYETKQDGVNSILTAMQQVSRSHPIRVWSTDGEFLNVEQARTNYLKVAASNWHGLATYVGSFVPRGTAILFDIGSTTTDIIPIVDGVPCAQGKTDPTRLHHGELIYTGVRRSPVCSVLRAGRYAGELFATTLDAYVVLGMIPENPDDTDTADGRPATREKAHARLSRMVCGDPEITSREDTEALANQIRDAQFDLLQFQLAEQYNRMLILAVDSLGDDRVIITSGSGEFLALDVLESLDLELTDQLSLTNHLGVNLATCAPAYAMAVLATERPA